MLALVSLGCQITMTELKDKVFSYIAKGLGLKPEKARGIFQCEEHKQGSLHWVYIWCRSEDKTYGVSAYCRLDKACKLSSYNLGFKLEKDIIEINGRGPFTEEAKAYFQQLTRSVISYKKVNDGKKEIRASRASRDPVIPKKPNGKSKGRVRKPRA